MELDMKELGSKIKSVRGPKSQESVAGAAKVAVRTLQRLEDGEGNPTLITLVSLSNALNVKLSSIIPEDLLGAEATPKADAPRDITFAAAVLSSLSKLPPHRQNFALALIFQDESYLVGSPLAQFFQTLTKES